MLQYEINLSAATTTLLLNSMLISLSLLKSILDMKVTLTPKAAMVALAAVGSLPAAAVDLNPFALGALSGDMAVDASRITTLMLGLFP